MNKTLTIEDILSVKEPADRVHMSLSPDNKWLSFCISGTTEDKESVGVSEAVRGNTQWVCNLQSESAFPIAPQSESSWAGVWSPDETVLAFFADIDGIARLCLWSASNQKIKVMPNIIARPFFGFEKPIWSKDGQSVIIKSMPEKHIIDNGFSSFSKKDRVGNSSNPKPKVFTIMENSAEEKENNQQSWVNIYRADIVMIDIETEASTTLSRGLRPVGIALSNDGKYIAFTSCMGEEKKNTQQNMFDLYISSLQTENRHSEQQCIAEGIRMNYGMNFSWGHNDQSIYYTTSGTLSDGNLWLVDLVLQNRQKLLFGQKEAFLSRDYEGPVLISNGLVLLVANGDLWCYSTLTGHTEKITLTNGRKITTIFPDSNQTGTNVVVQTMEPTEELYGFWKVNYTTGETEKIMEEPRKHIPWYEGGAIYGRGNNLEVITYWAQSADQPPAIMMFDVASKTGSCIVEFTKLPAEVELGSAQVITWTKEGSNRRGALLLPRNKKGPVPAIMRVYGGSMQSKNMRSFGISSSAADNHQLFSSHGYAVFLPDLPMTHDHEPADEITAGIEDAFNALAEHPYIDPDRIGIIGHSFGGYSALIAITRLQCFKAAVISSGIGNLISLYTDFDNSHNNYGLIEHGQMNMGVTLWENRERYIRNSPLFHFHKIKTPVLIVQGSRDNLCRNEAGPIFASLKRLNKTAELVLYDEGHWQGTWRKENIRDYYDRVLSWFNKYM